MVSRFAGRVFFVRKFENYLQNDEGVAICMESTFEDFCIV